MSRFHTQLTQLKPSVVGPVGSPFLDVANSFGDVSKNPAAASWPGIWNYEAAIRLWLGANQSHTLLESFLEPVSRILSDT